MKYSAIALLLLGVAKAAQSTQYPINSLVQTSNNQMMSESESESESESSSEGNLVQVGNWRDDGIIDAFTPPRGQCEERLWIDPAELEWQMDQFSRNYDVKHYNNAMVIAKKLGVKPPRVHAWELMDASFSFPRVRRYDTVQQNMDMLEHFQDNLNTNISNQLNVDRFIRVAQTVKATIAAKYHNGEFDDPANTDPRSKEEEEGF